MSFWINFIYLLSLIAWIGGILFFSFFTTPMIFKTLPREMASQLISSIFPNYYNLGYFCGAGLLLTTILDSMAARPRGTPWIRILLIVIMLGCNVYAGIVLRPQTHALKIELKSLEEGSELGIKLKTRFDSLHRWSVILNMVVLAAGLFLVGILAWRLRV